MAADSEKSTSKVVVQTYLPEYQRDEWDAHADELDMSRSEFVKAMVQAGWRGFDGAPPSETRSAAPEPPEQRVEGESAGPEGASPSGRSLEETVVEALSASDYLSWDDLLATVTDDIESRLEETLQTLQSDGRIRYSGRQGGYTLDR